jgi:lipoprotein-releasing system permease protein
MSYELFIAGRFLRAKRKTGFISLITYISIAGVVIGVAALIIVLSVMNGYESEVRSRLIGVGAHVKVRTYHHQGIENYHALMTQLKTIPHIQAMTPYIDDKGLIISAKTSTGALIRGFDSSSVDSVLDISKSLILGKLDFGLALKEGEKSIPGIVLGDNLADKLSATIGDVVTLASLAGVKSFGQLPNMMQFRVTGRFKTGLYEFDNTYCYLSIPSAQVLFNMGQRVSGIDMRLDNLDYSESVAQQVIDLLGYPYRALTWYDLNMNLFAWYKIQKWAGGIILSLIIIVAAFNIASTLIMVTMEKTKEIGILKSMGATPASIRRIFTFEGLFVGMVGSSLGCLLGYLLCWAQQTYRFFSLPQDVYIIGWLPILMRWSDFALIGIGVFLITYLASVYPAARAAKLDPVAAIRFD